MSAQASIETVRPAWSGVLADGLPGLLAITT